MQESDITKGVGCSCCRGMTVVNGINDFASNRPELVKYFIDKSEAYKNTKTSGNIAHLKCPVCGKEKGITFKNLYKYGFFCKKCNSIGMLRPELIKYFINTEDAFDNTIGGRSIIGLKCPSCGYIKNMDAHSLCADGFSCPMCSDGISYPEKFVMNFLEQLNIKYIYQLTKKHFEWCKNYRYDFYLVDYKCIVEVNGSQHYYDKQKFYNYSLENIKINDNNKMINAMENGIKEYIIIPAIKSRLNDLKDSITDSFKDKFDLSKKDKFDLSKIDWIKCSEFASKSIIKDVCDYFNNNKNKIYIIDEMCNKFKISASCLRNYLHKGNENGWCNYTPREIKTKKSLKPVHNSIPVNIYDCNNNLIYKGKSLSDTERFSKNKLKLNISSYRIKSLCKNNNIYMNYYFKFNTDI